MVAPMQAREFAHRVNKLARKKGMSCEVRWDEGVGSHGTLYLGDRVTTIKAPNKELGKGLVDRMCKDLGIDPDDIQ